ncbi:MAG TPA: hypothetical protein VFQ88_05605 [Nevskiaceae bacterium]|nr:hypothetical protein [Nevskiaceae bacterium]
MSIDFSLTRLSARFQLWLIGSMAPLAAALAAFWWWPGAVLEPRLRLLWVAGAVEVCVLAWWGVRYAFDVEGKFRGWPWQRASKG